MKEISWPEFERRLEGVFSLGDGIKELPYCGLEKRNKHRYGKLKAWIKMKALAPMEKEDIPAERKKAEEALGGRGAEERSEGRERNDEEEGVNLPEEGKEEGEKTKREEAEESEEEWNLKAGSWEELVSRPIASYRAHFWRGLLRLAARFCVAAVRELQWGFHADCPRSVAGEIRSFSERMQREKRRRFRAGRGANVNRDEDALGMALWDITDFFPNVHPADLEDAVRQAVAELQEGHPDWIYF